MHKAMESCRAEGNTVGISVGDQQITDLDYADDIALLSESEHDLQVFVGKVIFFGNLVGLRINPNKSKVMSFCSRPPRIIINGLQLERVEQFRYLGSLISANASCEKDVLSRIGFAQASFQILFTGLFSREDISIQHQNACLFGLNHNSPLVWL